MSVVIPCFKYGNYLPDAVASAFDQDGVDVDVLIVDDASPDDSAQVALRLAAADERVEVLVHEVNRGHIQTYNDGLVKVTGDYVVLLSADDLLARNALTRAVALMEHHPRVGLVYGWAQSFEEAPLRSAERMRSWSVWSGQDWLGVAAGRGRCFLASPEAVMRREALDDTDGYDPRLPHSGDFDMWLRTATRWDIGRVNGPIQAHYRVHGANMHLNTYAGWLKDLTERRGTFEILFAERVGADRDDVRSLRPAAMRALAAEALRRGLRAHRDATDPEAGRAELETYASFAFETSPASRTSLAGMLVRQRLASGRAPTMLLGPRRFGSRLRDHLVWRRHRRFGV